MPRSEGETVSICSDVDFEILSYEHGSSVVVIPGGMTWVKTSATGQFIIESLQRRPRPLAALIEDVARHYQLPGERVAAGVRRLVEELIKVGVAECGPGYDRDFTVTTMDSLGLQEVWYNLTDRCNLSCRFCYVPSIGPSGTHAPAELVLRVIEEAAEMGVRHLLLAGGEPTLHPDLPRIAQHARRQGSLRIKLVTNGSWRDDVLADHVLSCVDDLQVSLDGAQEEVHDRVRGRGAFRRAVELLGSVRRQGYGGAVGISFTPLPSNLDQLTGLYRLALAVGADYLHLNRPKVPGRRAAEYEGNGGIASAAWFARALEAYDQLLLHAYRDQELAAGLTGRRAVNIDISFDPGSQLFSPIKRHRCAAGVLTVCIGPDGNCYPCAALCRGEFSWGSVAEESLPSVYGRMREAMQGLFDVERDEECRNCLYRYFCGGGCRASGGLQHRDPACDLLKRRYHSCLGHVTDVRAAGFSSPTSREASTEGARGFAVPSGC